MIKTTKSGWKLSEERKEQIRQFMLGRAKLGLNPGFKAGNKVWLGRKHSEETKRKIAEGRMGERNWMWKGGITPTNKRLRTGKDWKDWRKGVFERDDYTCQFCGKRGGEIHPDHIKPFAFYPELRFDVSNGRTLCRSCHLKTPTWGNRKIYVEN